MKKLFFVLSLVFTISILSSTVNAQYQVRMAAEFDPCTGTLITWPLGIPKELVIDLAKEDILYIAVGSTAEQTSATSQFTTWGVNLNNCVFVQAPHNTHWSRDWGPNCTFDSAGEAGILDFIFKGYLHVPGCGSSGSASYFGSYTKDDAANSIMASTLGLPLRFMPSYFVGGNNMVDGLGTAISSHQIIKENEKNAIDSSTFRAYAETYCGINNYYFVDNPEHNGIQHIDCFAKFLDEETILIKEVNPTNPDYDCVEHLADQIKAMNSIYGRPYRIVRILAGEYSGNLTAAYTNALILNKKVYVPLFGISTDSTALQTYRDAMPGYTVTGYTSSGASKWYYYDALHCRTMGIFDKDMLRIVHRPMDSIVSVASNLITISAAIDARSGEALMQDSCLLYWRIKGASTWQSVQLTNTSVPDSVSASIPSQLPGTTIEYYLKAADLSGRVVTLPRSAPSWVFSFTTSGSACLIPTGLNSTNITANSADLNWNAVEISSKYKIQYKKALPGESWTIVNVTAPASTYHLSALSSSTKYKWRIKSLCGTDKSSFSEIVKFTTDAQKANSDASKENRELTIYPNPVESFVQIGFTLKESSTVSIDLLDVQGKMVRRLFTGHVAEGIQQLNLDMTPFANGIYMCRVMSKDFVEIVKIVKQ